MKGKLAEQEDDLDKSSGVWGRVKQVAGEFRIEPAHLFHGISYQIGDLFLSNILIYKACHVNLGYNVTFCEDLVDVIGSDDKSDIEKEAQEIVAGTEIWSSVIDNFFPIIYLLLLGAWSDIYGRKLPYLVSISGYLITYGLLMLAYSTSWNVQVVALVGTLPSGVTGGRTAIAMILFSYIADTTSVRDRIIRIGLASGVDALGKSLGSGIGGQIAAARLGYYWGFGIAAGLQLAGFVWAWAAMKDKGTALQDSNYKKFMAIFDLSQIRDSFTTFFKKRENGLRCHLLLLTVAFLAYVVPTQAEGSLPYNFSRVQLGWDAGKFGTFNTFNVILGSFGGLVSVVILSRWMGLSDGVVGLLVSSCQIASSVIYAFVYKDWMMYLAMVVDMFSGTMQIASRSMISKIIPGEETGKICSFMGVLDKVSRLPLTPIYNAIYGETLDTFPGAIFLLSAALSVPGNLVFTFLACSKKNRNMSLE